MSQAQQKESEEFTHATIRGQVDDISRMLDEASLDGETSHDSLYINVLPDEVQVLMAAPGNVVLTYCTYSSDYFDEIDVPETETRETSDGIEYEVGAEAIIDVDAVETYLGYASDGGTVELRLTGSKDRRLASYMRIEGALESWVNLPGSEDILDKVPFWLPMRYNEDDDYCNKQGDPAPARVLTRIDQIEKIIRAVDEDRDAELYPITTEDGEFNIDVGDESRSGVKGSLQAKQVTGPDISNYYFDGFAEVTRVLSGPIDLQTAPGGPIAFVQTNEAGRVVRHAVGITGS